MTRRGLCVLLLVCCVALWGVESTKISSAALDGVLAPPATEPTTTTPTPTTTTPPPERNDTNKVDQTATQPPATTTTTTPAAGDKTQTPQVAVTTTTPQPAPQDNVQLQLVGTVPVIMDHVEVASKINSTIKSMYDNRRYRRINLDNGLDVLLISDPKCTRSAAAMDVGMGYWADPDNIPGLAHFLEHMLFMGTAKYPDEDSYSGFLSRHGGGSNAYTSMENTNYFFDVQPRFFSEALDRFAQFFIAPLFSISGTEREVHAVESENAKNLQSDTWRMFQLVQGLANSTHPFHKFGTGNKESLGSQTGQLLQDELKKLFQKYYYASNMRLAVLSRASLPELEMLVKETFAKLPVGDAKVYQHAGCNCERMQVNNTVPLGKRVADESQFIWVNGTTGSTVEFKMVENVKKLLMLWTIPPQIPFYKKKSVDYISSLLGQEGHGSLISYLKTAGLAAGLTAGSDLSTGAFDLYQVDITLTNKGAEKENIVKIVDSVFAYLNLIEKSGVELWRWKEQATISAIRFRLKNIENPESYVSELSSSMGKFLPSELLIGPSLYEEYDSTHIHDLLSLLTPSSMLLLIGTHENKTYASNERWYGTPYTKTAFDQLDLAGWADTRINGPKVDPGFLLPTRNQFIPASLEVKEPEFNYTRNLTTPLIVYDVVDKVSAVNGSVRVWFKQDTSFRRPRAMMACRLWTELVYASPRDVVMSTVFVRLVRDFLQEFAYPASVAGFDFNFASDVDGFDLHFAGYDDGLQYYVSQIAKYLALASPTSNSTKGFVPKRGRFDNIKEELAQNYDNFLRFSQPHQQAAYHLSCLVEEPHWHITEYATALHHITLEDVIEWSHLMWEDMGMECLVTGNMHQKEAINLALTVTGQIDYRSNSMAYRSKNSRVQRIVQVDGAYSFFAHAPNPNELNSAVFTYYQQGQGRIEDDVLSQLVGLIAEKPAFHQLRTVEQLGYIVWSDLDRRGGVNGLKLIVQSATHGAEYLDGRISNFLVTLRDKVSRMSLRRFLTLKRTLLGIKRQRARNLGELSARYWGEITSQQYIFHRRRLEREIIRQLNVGDVRDFFDELIGYNNVPLRLSVRINSQHVSENETASASQQQQQQQQQQPQPVQQATAPQQQPPAAPQQQTAGATTGPAPAPTSQQTPAASQRAAPAPRANTRLHQQPAVPIAAKARFEEIVAEPLETDDEDENERVPQGANSPFLLLELTEKNSLDQEPQRVTLQCIGVAVRDDDRCKCATQPREGDCRKYRVVVISNGIKPVIQAPAADATTSQFYNYQTPQTPVPAPAPAPALSNDDESSSNHCSRSGSARFHSPRPLTLSSISLFKNSVCLYPRRPVGRALILKDAEHRVVV